MLCRRFRVAVLMACVDRCTGRAFGLSRVKPVVTIGGVGCTAAKWVSDEQIECTTPPTSSGVHDLVVRVGVNEVSKKDAFTSLTPVISTLIPPSGKKVGGYPRCLLSPASPRLASWGCAAGLQERTRSYLYCMHMQCACVRVIYLQVHPCTDRSVECPAWPRSAPRHFLTYRNEIPSEATSGLGRVWSWLRFLRSHSCAQSAAIHRILLPRGSERGCAARRAGLAGATASKAVLCGLQHGRDDCRPQLWHTPTAPVAACHVRRTRVHQRRLAK